MNQYYLDGLSGMATHNSLSNTLGLLQREQEERFRKQNEDFAASQRNHSMAKSSTPPQSSPSYIYSRPTTANNSATTSPEKTEPKSTSRELTEEEVEEIGQAILGLSALGAIVFAFASFLTPGYLSYQFLDYHLNLATFSGWAVFFISLAISVGYYFLAAWLLNKSFPNLDEESMVYLPLLPHAITAIVFWYMVFVY